jgi:hypothetical protein
MAVAALHLAVSTTLNERRVGLADKAWVLAKHVGARSGRDASGGSESDEPGPGSDAAGAAAGSAAGAGAGAGAGSPSASAAAAAADAAAVNFNLNFNLMCTARAQCVGLQTLDTATNLCVDPACGLYYFQEVHSNGSTTALWRLSDGSLTAL